MSLIKAYIELTKPRILAMVLVTAAMGFFLGGFGIPSVSLFLYSLLGIGLSSAGAGALNHYCERNSDALMERTKNRPIPTEVIQPNHALIYGILLSLLGFLTLALKVNLLTTTVVIITSLLYIFVYTPLKKISWLNTLVGAIPGALPPIAGWTAVTNSINIEAWVLFWILFLWQHPHFYAIAWLYKDDYKRANYQMLPVVEPDGKRMFRQILWHSFLLIPVSLIPTLLGRSGSIYFVGTLILGLTFFTISLVFCLKHTETNARRLLLASVIYLPILLALVVWDIGF